MCQPTQFDANGKECLIVFKNGKSQENIHQHVYSSPFRKKKEVFVLHSSCWLFRSYKFV